MITYSPLLTNLELPYREHGNYLVCEQQPVEEVATLHISVVMVEMEPLLRKILPFLRENRINFKVAKNIHALNGILQGAEGYEQAGKVLSIDYTDERACTATLPELIELTNEFNGQQIAGCLPLNNAIYVPMELSAGFSTWLKALPPSPKMLKKRYRLTACLKPDLKGDVYKAFYLKKALWLNTCIVKQGRRNAWSDVHGRTIADRLAWQADLHQRLPGPINVPAFIEFFTEEGHTYLALEYIPGISLEKKARQVSKQRIWADLARKEKIHLLDHLITAMEMVAQLHSQGIVHRDLSPANFMVTPKGKLYLIDFEMAVDVINNRPSPAFSGGTNGFISPQQSNNLPATVADDIYCLGGLMLDMFTQMPAIKLPKNDPEKLMQGIYYLTGDPQLAKLTAQCLSIKPESRPSLAKVIAGLKSYREIIHLSVKQQQYAACLPEDRRIDVVLHQAILGLTHPAFSGIGNMFATLSASDIRINNRQTARLEGGGLSCPIAGLWLLGRRDDGLLELPDLLLDQLKNYRSYFLEEYLKRMEKLPPALQNGNAGVALTLAWANTCRYFEPIPDLSYLITKCLGATASTYGLAFGKAGQLYAAVEIYLMTGMDRLQSYINNLSKEILTDQLANGSWPAQQQLNISEFPESLASGTAGILIALLRAYDIAPSDELRQAITRGLKYTMKGFSVYDGKVETVKPTENNLTVRYSLYFGNVGIAYAFLQGYRLLSDPEYRQAAECLLFALSDHPAHQEFGINFGLSGWGLVYMEAYQTLGNNLWLHRAGWIAGLFELSMHVDEQNRGYWSMDSTDNADGSLLTGTIGIIYFLSQYRKEMNNLKTSSIENVKTFQLFEH